MFVQKTFENIAKCNGCDEKCHISSFKENESCYLPVIGDLLISHYIDRYGNRISDTSCRTAEKAMVLAQKISKLCDNYKQRTR